MSNTVKVFIASSIVEFADVRDDVENFLWRLRFERGLDVMPVRCETADPSMSVTRKEDDYCELIRRSEVCIFLFDKKLGAYSLEEYEFAVGLNSSGGGPLILAFFRGGSLADFRQRVQSDGFEAFSFGCAQDVCDGLFCRLGGMLRPCSPVAANSTVNIFFASSIKDDERRRVKIENFIWKMNCEFMAAYGLSVRPLLSEGGNPDGIISASRMCFFIVFARVGADVRGELDFAKKYFEANGFPKIYVYFNAVADGCAEERSVADFKEYLDRELNHFYGTFSGIDTIKLRILLNLAVQETGSREVSFKDGKCFFGGDALFSVDNVSEFANNKKLALLKDEFYKLSAEYNICKHEYEKNRGDRQLCERYYDVATRYMRVRRDKEELEDNIFGVAVAMSRDEVHGLITPKQKQAYRYFEAGEVERAVAILDVDETLRGYERAEKFAAKKAEEVIAEGRLKIEFLKTMYLYKERYDIIAETYEKLLPVASGQQVCMNVYNEYALFLLERDRHAEALQKAQLLQTLYTVFPSAGNAGERAENLTVMAAVCAKMSDMQKQAEEYSLAAIELRKDIISSGQSDEANMFGIANSHFVLGDIYRREQRFDDALFRFGQAAALYGELCSRAEKYAVSRARALINTGIVYGELGRAADAQNSYSLAAEVLGNRLSSDPEQAYTLSSCYQNSAVLYGRLGQNERAAEMFSRALEVRIKLTDDDPAGYMPALAYSYQGLGNAFRARRLNEKAEENFKRAYELRKVLCSKNANAHETELSDSCAKLAGVLLDQNRTEAALPYIEECFAIRSRLYSVRPQTYRKWYSQIVFEYGRYYEQKDERDRAVGYYDEALALRTEGDVQIAPNAEALHDSFTKLKQMYGDDFALHMDTAAAAVYERLYGYNAVHGDDEKLRLVTSYMIDDGEPC